MARSNAPAHLLMTGSSHSQNTILPETPSSALTVWRLCPSQDALSVMYITDSGQLFMCMFWEGERQRAF
jgi:hypothetical protein